MTQRSAILVNGARGHLGKAVVAHITDRPVLRGIRRDVPEDAEALLIETDGTVDPAALSNVTAIINCAGQVTGERESVWQANVEHPIRLATIAKAAGVRRFVQVSSFSIFGHAERIDEETKIAPVNLYGESKRAAETGLSALQDENFSIICVRLPFMFGAENTAMMGSLIKVLSRLPLLPTSPLTVQRSMLTYRDAAFTLVQAALGGGTGAICAADPAPFTFDLLAQKMRDHGKRPARFIAVPVWLCRAAMRIVPGAGRRLFASSVLCASSNALNEASSIGGVEAEIEAILRAN